VTVRTSLFQNS